MKNLFVLLVALLAINTAIAQRSIISAQSIHHRDTITLRNGFLAMDTSVTTDTIVFRLPSSPYHGMTVEISSVSAVTNCAFINGTINNPVSAFTAGLAVAYTYNSTKSKWYRRK